MADTPKKIAVMLIHGIGEQRPLDTLRGFVTAVVRPDSKDKDAPKVWSKPDAVSGSFDLRRFRTGTRNATGGRRPSVDFYEYYWAHKTAGNTLSHTYQWLATLLLRKSGSVPPKLRGLWRLAWAVALLIAALVTLAAWWKPAGALAIVAALVGIVAKIVQNFALRDYLGDSARYFDSHPGNVAVREEIRRGAVELLEGLHASGDYFRIIVVGHSLGSAIALDALYHYWTLAADKHANPEDPRHDAVERLEKALKEKKHLSPCRLRVYQKSVWREMQSNGVPWQISDLITLGSPLTHFPYLVGLSASEFEDRMLQREIPCSPPVLDDGGLSYGVNYTTASGKKRTIRQLHHAACFAACRWTNIYFPHSGLIGGDPIGGPLAGKFGGGILDRDVATKHWNGRLTHGDYWRDDLSDACDPKRPMLALDNSLRLGERLNAKRAKASRRSQAVQRGTATV